MRPKVITIRSRRVNVALLVGMLIRMAGAPGAPAEPPNEEAVEGKILVGTASGNAVVNGHVIPLYSVTATGGSVVTAVCNPTCSGSFTLAGVIEIVALYDGTSCDAIMHYATEQYTVTGCGASVDDCNLTGSGTFSASGRAVLNPSSTIVVAGQVTGACIGG